MQFSDPNIEYASVATLARFLTIPFEKQQLRQQLQFDDNNFLSGLYALPCLAASIPSGTYVTLIFIYFLRNLIIFYFRRWLNEILKYYIGVEMKLINDVLRSTLLGAFTLVFTYPLDVCILCILTKGDMSQVLSSFFTDPITIYGGFVTSLIGIFVHRTVFYLIEN